MIKDKRQFNRECEVKQTTLSDRFGQTEFMSSDIHNLLELEEVKLNSSDELLLYFLNHQSILRPLEKVLYKFKNTRLFLCAATHTSFVHEFKNLDLESNEKLEFLGD